MGALPRNLINFNIPFEDSPMRAFVRRFLMHYGIYRRYPLGRLPSLRNAWRNVRA
jgi:hypothetical protein